MEEEGLEYLKEFLMEQDIRSMLEVGTAVGYSSICLAEHKKDLNIVTIEKDEARYQEAAENIAESTCAARIQAVCMDARVYESGEMFDLILLDGAKSINDQLVAHFDGNLKTGGYFVVDDVYLHGFVDHPEVIYDRRFRSLVRKLTKFKDDILQDERYESSYVEVGDGLIIAKKKVVREYE